MYAKNRRGPNTVPCGMPDSTLASVESLPLTRTF